jgi:hypothetical protein
MDWISRHWFEGLCDYIASIVVHAWLLIAFYSLAVPILEVIGGEGMKVAAGYADLPSIDLPSLRSLHGPLSFSGHIKRYFITL